MAKETILQFNDMSLQLVQGSLNKGIIKVEHFEEFPLYEGSMINGVITNGDNIKNVLLEIKKRKIEKVTLIIDSGKIICKKCVVPKASSKNLRSISINEVNAMEGEYKDLIYDYIVLEESSDGVGLELMCAAVEKSFLKSYIALLNEVGIKIKKIDISNNTLIKVTKHAKELKNKTYILSMVDGNNVSNLLFVDNQFVFNNRSRLFSTRETEGFERELATTIIQMLQFAKAQNKDRDVEAVYFCGLNEEEKTIFGVIRDTLNIKAEVFPNTSNILNAMYEEKFETQKYLVALGGLINRKINKKNILKKDIDFFIRYNNSFKRTSLETSSTIKYVILPFVLLALFGGGYYLLKQQEKSINVSNNELKEKIAILDTKLNNQEEAGKYKQYQEGLSEIATLTKIIDKINSYPASNSTMYNTILKLSRGFTIKSLKFDSNEGTIDFVMETTNASNAEKFIRALRETGVFEDIDYSGYTGNTISGDYVVNPETGEAIQQETKITYTMTATCVLKGAS